jgi:hypothetical protein
MLAMRLTFPACPKRTTWIALIPVEDRLEVSPCEYLLLRTTMSLAEPPPHFSSSPQHQTEPHAQATANVKPTVTPQTRPFLRVLMSWVRRTHLYLGLFLFPWAVLYGVTAFLFNHPTAFSDQASTRFAADLLRDTPFATLSAPSVVAGTIVEALQTKEPTSRYTLLRPDEAKYSREFAFANATLSDGESISILFDVAGTGGTIRSQPRTSSTPKTPAPFAIGADRTMPDRGAKSKSQAKEKLASRPNQGLALQETLADQVKATMPIVVERAGFSSISQSTITSVPDLVFRIDRDDVEWEVTYNALTGSVTGRLASEIEPKSISVRRFLTRLHLAHGYPSTVGTRWAWAVIVDLMAFVMCFWGISGLFMWWQIKSTRIWGLLTLGVSAALACALGFGMYAVLVS